MEVAGTVATVGETVEGYEVGDTVVAFTPDGGGFTELVCADARLSAQVPAGLDLATAAGMPLTWATALGLVRRRTWSPATRSS
jgi:NADPH2:quinone reductase